jgi:hypothetical protein
MIVKIIKDDSEHGCVFPNVGEFYKAKAYIYDSAKVTLLYQVDPSSFKKLAKQHCDCSDLDPLVNEYRCNVEIINQ